MTRTLYARLALALFVLLCLVGVFVIGIVSNSTAMYEQEVAQKLNRELAEHIVHEYPLIENRAVNQSALEDLFHQLMVINPSIEAVSARRGRLDPCLLGTGG